MSLKFSIMLYILCSVTHLQAAEIAGVKFSDTYQDEGVVMTLQGTGLKTVIFFKAFVAGYYTVPRIDGTTTDESPKRIEVEYFVNIPAKKLNVYTVERMKVNVTQEELEAIQAEVELMGKYFVDLKPGDRFALTYIPDVGTKFEHKGKVMGVIEGNAFAKALFSVWIGAKPFDEQLKQVIMGGGGVQQANASDGIIPGFVSKIVEFGPAQTRMNATVSYGVVGKYQAHFKNFKGSMAIDEATSTIQSVLIEIDTDSLQSTCGWCDMAVRSARLLNIAQYPKIIFKGKDIVENSDGLHVQGILEIRGLIKEVLLPCNVITVNGVFNVKGKWVINRKDFGIRWSKFFDHGGIVVGDEIQVEWDIKIADTLKVPRAGQAE